MNSIVRSIKSSKPALTHEIVRRRVDEAQKIETCWEDVISNDTKKFIGKENYKNRN